MENIDTQGRFCYKYRIISEAFLLFISILLISIRETVMRCPKCGVEQQNTNTECLNCGLIFQKYRERQERKAAGAPDEENPVIFYEDNPTNISEYIQHIFFHVEPENNPLIVWARVGFFLVILVWGLKFIFTPFQTNYALASVWHHVNLPFHEAGHIIFRPFGRFITSLGGSLGQLLMPCICMAVFLLKTRDTFAASFTLWWLGENFMDLAPYINDAKALVLPLVGGNTGRTSPYGFHDWEFILREAGLLKHYHGIAWTAQIIGIVLMICSFFWGGYILYKQLRQLRSQKQ